MKPIKWWSTPRLACRLWYSRGAALKPEARSFQASFMAHERESLEGPESMKFRPETDRYRQIDRYR